MAGPGALSVPSRQDSGTPVRSCATRTDAGWLPMAFQGTPACPRSRALPVPGGLGPADQALPGCREVLPRLGLGVTDDQVERGE